MEGSRFIRIMAGPGTGKTTSLMNHLKDLLGKGTDPKRILLVTFTRTAAADLAEALRKTGVSGTNQIEKGTLHSFCLKVLHDAHFFLQVDREPRILLDYETRFVLEDLRILLCADLKACNLHRIRDLERLLKAFEALWAREQSQEPEWASDGIELRFETKLRDWLRFHQAMLLSEIVPETLTYLRENPLSDVRSRFAHILVDEYQDLNRAEQSLIDILSNNSGLVVAGDQDQSIYEHFRFAHPEGIAEFSSTHSDTREITLDKCRRCPTNIVEMANALINHNRLRQSRRLVPDPSIHTGEVIIVQWESMEDEAEGLARFIRDRNFDLGQVLVLCPRRQFGYAIRDALVCLGCQAASFFQEEVFDGTPRQLDRSQSQQAFTLLCLFANNRDRVALRCWLGFGHNELYAVEYRRLRDYCYHNSIHPFDALEQVVCGGLSLTDIRGITERYRILRDYLNDFSGKPLSQVFVDIFPKNEDWAHPFHEMVDNIDDSMSPGDLVARLYSQITQPELPQNVPYVRVMSLHKAKGLTADHVIVSGFIEGLIPAHPKDSMTDYERERYQEEQRRLFYVAITRARRTLVLSSVTSLPRGIAHAMGARVQGGGRDYGETITSTFLRELGPACPRPIPGRDLLRL